ncbi:MAG: hypothetical protein ACRDD8_06345 [Bacteroidales bacterium]
MTFNEFKIAAIEEVVSTVNGWGFGGVVGKKYTIKTSDGDISALIARRHYRHAPPTQSNSFYFKNQSVTKAEFLLLIADIYADPGTVASCRYKTPKKHHPSHQHPNFNKFCGDLFQSIDISVD